MTPLVLASREAERAARRLLDSGADLAIFSDGGLHPPPRPFFRGRCCRGPSADRPRGGRQRPEQAFLLDPPPGRLLEALGAGGNTPLHLAVLSDRPDIVKLLLRRKAERQRDQTSIGQRPIRYARTAQMKEALGQPARD